MATAHTVVFVIKHDHISSGWGWGGTIPSKVGEAGTVLVLPSPEGPAPCFSWEASSRKSEVLGQTEL